MASRKACDSILVSGLVNVRYLTGFTGSSGCALVTPRKRAFFTDSRYRLQARRQVKGFETVIVNQPPLLAACRFIRSRRLKVKTLGFEGAHLSSRDLRLVRRSLGGIRLKDVSGCVEDERLRKSGKELSRIRRAARLADLAFEKLRRTRVAGMTERQLAWILERTMREAGSGPLPFEIIVASGPRSAMPHGVAGRRRIRPGELLLVDLGASVDGYCSDMTRTFATGALNRRQEEMYRAVREAQELALAGIRPGAACAGIDRMARDHIDAAGLGPAFDHSLGHGVGLEAHEGPVLSSRSSDVLQPGMVVTVEPGVYLGRAGGVRIEDTVLVGARGPIRLTRFPRRLITLK